MVHLATAALPVRVSVEMTRPPEVAIRAWREITRTAHAQLAELWHRQYLPLHFRQDAAAKYGYQPRDPKYLRRKAQRGSAGSKTGIAAGGRLPLVYTGQLRNAARTFVQIRGFPTRGVVTMALPSYATIKPWNTGRPNMAQELTATTAAERQELAEFLAQQINKRLDRLKSPRTERSS